MKKKVWIGLIILGFCVPYSFLSMYDDIMNRSMLLYGVMIVAMGVLCWGAIKMKNMYPLMIGNTFSCIVSCVCINLFRTEEWGWYFKPLTAYQLAIGIAVVSFLIQISVWSASMKKEKR